MSILDIDKCKYSHLLKEGNSLRMYVPFLGKSGKIHITNILKDYYGKTLVVYRVFGTHKRWWHTFMMDEYSIYTNIKQGISWDKYTKNKINNDKCNF